uniref:Nuclear factor erythroid-derived 2-like 2 n=1 Tax=Takifugu rubripes TaxID=31033 RepID=Q1KKS5_TAKRU|nr:nuclear factor erythroid-derived 2-like 2 [Takifugu rubripes]
MNLIDILWKQDIDLGASREVFDYNHRQKEHELQRQLEQQEEKRLHLLREQEKALLAQLQLDEETGEYVPRPVALPPLQSAVIPLEVSQDVSFPADSGDAMSFDECLQLLAETFPVGETENSSVGLNTTEVRPMLSPELAAVPSPTLSPDPLSASPSQAMCPELEEAWMELLSLPELQPCLNIKMEDAVETAAYPLPPSPDAQNPNCQFYQTNSAEVETNAINICPVEFLNTVEASVPSMVQSDHLTQADSPQFHTDFAAESFGEMFYSNPVQKENTGQHGLDGYNSDAMSDMASQPFTPAGLYSLSPGDAFDKHDLMAELPDSDSGISSHTSPNASSPGKSVYGDGSFHHSDSDMEEMDHNPGSAETDFSEMFSINFEPDDLQRTLSVSALERSEEQMEGKLEPHKMDSVEECGQSGAPFTKDKKRRSDARLSRDEQRAKALKIPLSVSRIINLPVDDFKELLSKHHLNDAQMALVQDIRRRGKNKVAAQNCRKRKMENIVGLEGELDSLKEEKERLLSEKVQKAAHLKEMKQQLNSLYLEVFSKLRDEKGNSYSPSEYSLQQSTNGSIFLVPRVKKTLAKSDIRHMSSA